MMLGSNHEGDHHPDQLLLLGSQAGTSHGRGTVRFLIRRGEAGSYPDELKRQLTSTAKREAYP
jgi:hypothetical protein